MPNPITLELEPDDQYNASLKGSDYRDSLVKSFSEKKIPYEVTDLILLQGHAVLNGKKEHASLVTFKVEASRPRECPVKKLELDSIFEDGDEKPRRMPAWRLELSSFFLRRWDIKSNAPKGNKRSKRQTRLLGKSVLA